MLVLLALAMGGCLPFAVPPLRASVGGGGAAGDVTVKDHTSEGEEVSAASRFEARVGLSAMTWRPERPIDVTAGWIGSWTYTLDGDARESRHGGYAEVNWFGYGNSTLRGERARGWRGGPSGTVELLDDRHGSFGGGASIGMMAEAFTFGTGESCDHDGCVYTSGETAIGVAARAGARIFEEGAQLYVIVSLELRLPAMIGFVWLDP
jgi:hypothetical protein